MLKKYCDNMGADMGKLGKYPNATNLVHCIQKKLIINAILLSINLYC